MSILKFALNALLVFAALVYMSYWSFVLLAVVALVLV
jgi:hypothetical protein